jgi:UDP-sugar pyrophosphorylase
LFSPDPFQFRTINVEYNQLDSLLCGAGYTDGDVNDPDTGCSPFPGNINQLVFQLGPYVETLERTKGLMPEFVNPKYKDESKTEFKSPTRLECMMQDFPIVLEGNDDYMKRVGFTTVNAELCFSPVKNNIQDGLKLQASGIQPATAATGEADQYAAQRIILRKIGANIDDAPVQEYNGIKVTLGPSIVFKPDFVQFPGDYFDKFPFPSNVKISNRSTLIVRGAGVVIESLDLDGTCIIDYKNGEKVTIRDKVIRNAGWKKVRDEESDDEIIRMRGYHIEKREHEKISNDSTMCCMM